MGEEAKSELSFPRRDKTELVRESEFLGGINYQLRETRRIAIGKKGDDVRRAQSGRSFRLPMVLDHFIVTLKSKDESDNFVLDQEIHKIIGSKPRTIPITFLYERPGLNAYPYLALYAGRTAWCKGNGKVAERLDEKTEQRKPVPCPCNLLDEGKCKPHLTLTARLPGMAMGEVAKFRTTSKRSISYILSGMKYILEETAAALGLPWQQGLLAKIPLQLKLEKETVVDREGNTRTIPTVGVSFAGTEEELEEHARKRMVYYKGAANYLQKLEMMKQAELKEHALLLSPEDPKTVQEIVEEFHPEAVDDVTSIDKVPTSRNFEAESRAKEKDRKEVKAVLDEGGIPEAIQKALENVNDDVLGEGEEPPKMRPEQRVLPRMAPRPEPPKKTKPQDDSFL